MLMSMSARPCPFGLFVFATCVVVGATSSFAEVKSNPYGGIVERNPFGLKPPPPPVVETNQEPAAPPPNVKLTGISNLFSKRALLEITEQQAPSRPGQPPVPGGTVNRPILGEGEEMLGIEVVAIDLEKSIVRIRNGGTESDLTFEVPKPSGGPGPAPAPVGRTASVAPTAPTMGQPTIVSASESRGGITMLGGGGGFTGNAGGVSTYGGAATPASYAPGGVPNYGGGAPGNFASAGTPTIPSRQLRTANVPAPTQPIDPDTQEILIEANRIRQNTSGGSRGGLVYPPLPPTRLSREMGVQ